MEVKCIGGSDRISTLPQEITTQILSLLPTRDALRTSILARKWRYCWMRVSAISFEDNMFKRSNYTKEIKKLKLVNAIFHVLLLHTSPLVKFSLTIDVEMVSELDLIIIYLSRSDTLQELSLVNHSDKQYRLPCSFFSLQGLWFLRVTNCHFGPPLTFNGFSKLTWLSFTSVEITFQILKRLLTNCPLLGTLHLLGGLPIITGEKDLTFVELYECLPSIQVLGFSTYYLKYFAAGGMPQKLPNSSLQVNTLSLSLSFMDRDALSCAVYLIKSTPNLMTLYIRSNLPPTSTDILDLQDYSDFKLDHLQSLWMFTNNFLPIKMNFVKLVMEKASVLNKALIELDINLPVYEELKILRDLIRLPFPRASPSAQLFVYRCKTSSYYFRNVD